MVKPTIYTVAEAAKIAGLRPGDLRTLLRLGLIKSPRAGKKGRSWILDEAALEAARKIAQRAPEGGR